MQGSISIHLKTFGYRTGSAPPLSLFLSLLIFFNEIDVDAWEYERMPKYAPVDKFSPS